MKGFIYLLVITIILASCSIKEENKSIESKETSILDIIKMMSYKSLNEGDTTHWKTSSISLDTNSLKHLQLPNLEKLTTNDFYYINIFNGDHFKYNTGVIPIILSYNKVNPSQSLLLFPQDYCCQESTSEFFNQFINKEITEEYSFSKEMVNILLKTKVRHAINCDEEIYDLENIINSNADSLTIITRYKDSCVFDTKSGIDLDGKRKKFLLEQKLIFKLINKKISSINYNDWNK